MSLGQRIRPHLEMGREGLAALAAFDMPGHAVTIGGPHAPALPAGLGVVDAPVKALGVEAKAQHTR